MTKQEILKAIEKGESVWWITDEYILDTTALKVVELVYKDKYSYIKENKVKLFMKSGWWREFDISSLFKTKAEAEHYLHHANITRTVQLPFFTWEEFKKKKYFCFINYSDYYGMDTVNKEFSLELNVSGDKIILFSYEVIPLEEWEATEANFYKAYDECVRLFKGGE